MVLAVLQGLSQEAHGGSPVRGTVELPSQLVCMEHKNEVCERSERSRSFCCIYLDRGGGGDFTSD